MSKLNINYWQILLSDNTTLSNSDFFIFVSSSELNQFTKAMQSYHNLFYTPNTRQAK